MMEKDISSTKPITIVTKVCEETPFTTLFVFDSCVDIISNSMFVHGAEHALPQGEVAYNLRI